MRRLFTPVFALLALLTSGAAYAADKGGPAPAHAPATSVELINPWQGLYGGGYLGHSAGTLNDAEGFKLPREGYSAGGLIGYNHALQGIVIGLEADLGVADISGETNAVGFTVRGSNKALGSLRARIGRPFGGSLMPYVTAGFALQTGKLSVHDLTTKLSSSEENTRGYVFGGGVEVFPFSSNLGLRLEALRYQWVGQTYRIEDEASPKLNSHDTQVRAAVVVRLN